MLLCFEQNCWVKINNLILKIFVWSIHIIICSVASVSVQLLVTAQSFSNLLDRRLPTPAGPATQNNYRYSLNIVRIFRFLVSISWFKSNSYNFCSIWIIINYHLDSFHIKLLYASIPIIVYVHTMCACLNKTNLLKGSCYLCVLCFIIFP